MTYQYSYLRRADYLEAAESLGVPLAVIRAVAAVEGRNSGFIKGTSLPKILFEGHHFHRLTGGVFDARAPTISYPRWLREHYRGGTGEYHRLQKAIALADDDPNPALQSASWGMFQIMGFNHQAAGYDTVEEFVDWMSMGEPYHLRAFVAFIRANGLADELQSQDWASFAHGYNGPAFAKHGYDSRIAQAFRVHRLKLEEEATGGTFALDRGDLAAVQTALNAAIGTGLAADGWIGPKTEAAIARFRAMSGLPSGGGIDEPFCDALGVDLAHYFEREAVA